MKAVTTPFNSDHFTSKSLRETKEKNEKINWENNWENNSNYFNIITWSPITAINLPFVSFPAIMWFIC